MKYKIALLLKEHYRVFCEEQVNNKPDDMETDFFPYTTLEELQKIFKEIQGRYDGFYVSGLIPLQAIRNVGKQGRDALICNSDVEVANTYRILIQYLTGPNPVQLSRIGMDFLRYETNIEEVIAQNRFSEVVHGYESRWKTLPTLEEIEAEEADIVAFYKKQIEENKIDLIITYFYSVVEFVKKYNIPCYYVYPNPRAFRESMESLKKSISLRKMQKDKAAVICIDKEDMRAGKKDIFEKFDRDLEKNIQRLNRQQYNQLIFKNGYHNFEIYIDYSYMSQITKEFTECPMYEKLAEELGFIGNIGYGVGANLYQARLNAIDASHYGRNGGKNAGGSFLIDENENLTVLKQGQMTSTVKVSEDYIQRVANAVKLSAETIVRIMGVMNVMGTNEITSQDLVRGLEISLRNANKFLSNMQKHGYAEIVGQKRDGNKGRPINLYRLRLDYKA